MIEFATAVPPSPAKGVAAPPAVMVGGDFQRALAGMGDAAATPQPALIRLLENGGAKLKITEPPPPDLAVPTPSGSAERDPQVGLPIRPGLPSERQPIAEDGKPLPVETPMDTSKDMIWLLTGMIPAPVAPRAPKIALMLPPVAMDGAVAPCASPVQAASQSHGAMPKPLSTSDATPVYAGETSRRKAASPDLVVPTPPGPAGIDPLAGFPILPGLPNKREPIAEDGGHSPADTPDKDMSKDTIWLPVGTIPAPVAPPVPKIAVISSPVAVTLPPIAVEGASVPYASATQAGADLDGAMPKPLPSADWAPAYTGEASNGMAVATGKEGLPALVGRTSEAAKADLPVRIDVAAVLAPPPGQPVAPVIQPAGQAFAAAIAAVTPAPRDERETPDTRTPPGVATAAPDAVHKPAIQATADAQRGTLDLRQERGLQSMIDRIETLRDDADSRDTRIRLVPDALGTVDVSVRKDGERVHVHFAAENQASARLLSDAQPRLAELAEARGVKLGETSVDAGAGQPRQHRPAQPTLSIAPAAQPGAEDDDITDHRIA